MSPATLRFALTVALSAGVATQARAEPPGPAPEVDYRWKAATADAAFMAAGVIGFSLEGKDGSLGYVPSNMLMGAGTGGYFLGAPIVHVAHRHYARAAVSFALRVGLPIAGAFVGGRLADCQPDQFLCGLAEVGLGFAIGAGTAMVVDNLLLFAMSPSGGEPERAAPRPPASSGLIVSPRLALGHSAALLGLGGRF